MTFIGYMFELPSHHGFLFNAQLISKVIYLNSFTFPHYPLKNTKLYD